MIIIETCPKCGHDLIDTMIDVYPPIPKKICPSCGWHWEGEPEKVVRIPFGGNATLDTFTNFMPTLDTFTNFMPTFDNLACVYCSNNPKNGGSGICHCTLGTPSIT